MTTDQRRRFLIAYDIPSDTRRNRIATLLQSYGDRLQYSVFLIDAKPATLVRLKAAVAKLLHPNEDSLLIADLGQPEKKNLTYIGLRRSVTSDEPLVF